MTLYELIESIATKNQSDWFHKNDIKNIIENIMNEIKSIDPESSSTRVKNKRFKTRLKLNKKLVSAWVKNPDLSNAQLAKMFNVDYSSVTRNLTKYMKLSVDNRVLALL